MKKICWLAAMTLLSYSASGQKLKTAVAERHFAKYQYQAAAEVYEQVIGADSSNTEVMERLIHCYTRLNETEKAGFWLAKVTGSSKPDPKYFKAYATQLVAEGKLKEAYAWFNKSYKTTADQESKKWMDALKNGYNFYSDFEHSKVKKTSFNSGYSDFSPAFYKDGLIFCSARNSGKLSRFIYEYNNTWFIDLYYVKDSTSKPTVINKRINSKYHEGPVALVPDQDVIYFTRNNFLNKTKFSKDGVSKLKIYYASLKDGQWGEIQDFVLNNDEYSVGHPAFASANVMYFASDMPGGYGGTDLYKTEKVNGEWQKPVNLGPEINTSGNEMFPFVDRLGNLYFASNGHPGLGGLDVFYAPVSKAGFAEVKNLGRAINSPKDDFGFIIKNNTGYFTSNRNGGSVNDDIFSFEVDRVKPINILAMDEAGSLLHDVEIALYKTGETKAQVNNISQVPHQVTMKFGQYEKAIVSKKGYLPETIRLEGEYFESLDPFDTVIARLVKEGADKNAQVLAQRSTASHNAASKATNNKSTASGNTSTSGQQEPKTTATKNTLGTSSASTTKPENTAQGIAHASDKHPQHSTSQAGIAHGGSSEAAQANTTAYPTVARAANAPAQSTSNTALSGRSKDTHTADAALTNTSVNAYSAIEENDEIIIKPASASRNKVTYQVADRVGEQSSGQESEKLVVLKAPVSSAGPGISQPQAIAKTYEQPVAVAKVPVAQKAQAIQPDNSRTNTLPLSSMQNGKEADTKPTTSASNLAKINEALYHKDGTWILNKDVLTKASPEQKAEIHNSIQDLLTTSKAGEMIELGINYDFNKADIKPSAAEKLDILIEFLKRNPDVMVELGSHTDVRGSALLNQGLSQRRAESAVRYITSRGISLNRMTAVGFGKSTPKVVNARTEAEHYQNRRTVIKIVEN